MVANLDHPNIVPVYDVGSCDEFEYYIVSKYIEGSDLHKLLNHRRFGVAESATLIATVAGALHHAHKRGLVHRDVKPSNILIEPSGKPYVADFGLALAENHIGMGPRYAGTPSYMSPEQARGEGHRVDGRSDIFSLGAVLYELLSGRRAFRAETAAATRERVEQYDPRPLRQFDESIPKELERICQKALSKRASERYWTAHDMAEDLLEFLKDVDSDVATLKPKGANTQKTADTRGVLTNDQLDSSTVRPEAALDISPESEAVSQSPPPVVLPKGLRSFDSHDADFFLELLPGPRDRGGLPDSLRFWKTKIEIGRCR